MRDVESDALEAAQPNLIVSADVRCQTYPHDAGRAPARHWIEHVDNRPVN